MENLRVSIWNPEAHSGLPMFLTLYRPVALLSHEARLTAHNSPLVPVNKTGQVISSFFQEQDIHISPSTISAEKVLSYGNHTSLSSGSESKKNRPFFFLDEAV